MKKNKTKAHTRVCIDQDWLEKLVEDNPTSAVRLVTRSIDRAKKRALNRVGKKAAAKLASKFNLEELYCDKNWSGRWRPPYRITAKKEGYIFLEAVPDLAFWRQASQNRRYIRWNQSWGYKEKTVVRADVFARNWQPAGERIAQHFPD